MATKSEREWLYVLEEQIKNQNGKLDSIEGKLDKFIATSEERYVTKDEFQVVRKLVYGAAGTILTLVLIAATYAASAYITP